MSGIQGWNGSQNLWFGSEDGLLFSSIYAELQLCPSRLDVARKWDPTVLLTQWDWVPSGPVGPNAGLAGVGSVNFAASRNTVGSAWTGQ